MPNAKNKSIPKVRPVKKLTRRMPSNVVEHFGNGGGATLPLAIAFNLARELETGHCQVCLAGFGGGLVWAAMLMRLGGLSFCQLIDFP